MTNFGLLIFFAVLVWLAWRVFAEKPVQAEQPPQTIQPPQPPQKEDSQTRHLKSALQFVQAQHVTLKKRQREQDAWQQVYGHAKANELDHLDGAEFEKFLAGLFRAQGYAVEFTAVAGDYGGDLILSKDGQRNCVQAKRYAGSVGVSAVQEALSGKAYYQCDAAWVVTTGAFTKNALELAAKSGVKMIGRSDIGNLMAHTNSTNHGKRL